MSRYQLLPELTEDEYAALRDDIAARGVQVPIEIDDASGDILDGHHRLRACEELGITNYPVVRRAIVSEDAKITHVLSLNLNRRHLNREQRRELIERLIRRMPEASNVAIAKEAQADDKTVASVRRTLESTSEIPRLERRLGADGKSRPSSPIPRLRVVTDEYSQVGPEDDDDSSQLSSPEQLSSLLQPFMGNRDWKAFHFMEAMSHLDRIHEQWRGEAISLISQPGTPPREACDILRYIAQLPKVELPEYFRKVHSPDVRERNDALTVAAGKQRMPDPRLVCLHVVMQELKRAAGLFPHDPMTSRFRDVIADIDSIMKAIAEEAA